MRNKLCEFSKQWLAPTKVLSAVLRKTFSSSDTTDAITASMLTSLGAAIVVFKHILTSIADPTSQNQILNQPEIQSQLLEEELQSH